MLLNFQELTSLSKSAIPEETKSDEEFYTASDCTLQHSRSSSYNTASECEHIYAHWWEYNIDEPNTSNSKEKILVPVNKSESLPHKVTIKSPPEAAAGSSTVRSKVYLSDLNSNKRNGFATKVDETVHRRDEHFQEDDAVRIQIEEEENTSVRTKAASAQFEDEAWKTYRSATKHAIKGCL